ncbi:PaaI family thioesterase [Hyphococcus sp.]|uniref:PaaI family thioesterase n=1 Tax=Hyphococcus sp. TaxID=2038636 RepID=UPI002080E774|nr:MAG: hypothetical protein DHS20C04_27110 [Marinicaulis sp.]
MRSDLKQTFEHITTARGFTKESGFRVRTLEEGFVALEVAPKEELVQFLGYVHAGVVTGLADHAAGACYASVLPEGKACLTIELKINFMKPAKGDMLVAEATALSRGASVGVIRSDVFAETGDKREMVATALVTLKSIAT